MNLLVARLIGDVGGPAGSVHGPAVFGIAGWRLVPAHFAERHNLVIIIALGESIVALGVAARVDLTTGVVVAATLGIALASALWWVYFDVVALVTQQRLVHAAEGHPRNTLARDSYSLPALPHAGRDRARRLGLEETLVHLGEELDAVLAFALLGGVALYLLAHVALRLRNAHTINVQRLGLALALVAFVPVATELPALATLAVLTLQHRRLAAAVAGLLLVAVLRRVKVRYLPVYAVLGTGIWLTYESGVHATIACVALGLLAPARGFLPEIDADRIAHELSDDQAVTAADVRDISFRLRESIPVTERLQNFLHPWTSYLIVPVFALANAGVAISADGLRDAATSPVTLGVTGGLVLGKLIGVAGAIALAVRLGIGRLPDGVTTRHIVGMAAIAGIGFTVSIFVTGLAFDEPDLADQATIGVLAASALAAALGSAILATGTPRSGTPEPEADTSATASPAKEAAHG